MAKTNLRYYSYSVKHVHAIARSLVFFLFTVASYFFYSPLPRIATMQKEKRILSFFFCG